jgi:hypothetical protein
MREQLVAFQFKTASCVVAGTFNMYIVQPAWLRKVEIIPSGIDVAIRSKLDEPGFQFLSSKLPFRWFVSPSRIEVETKSPTEDCGTKVAAVLRALPWTPLVALGNNSVYTAPLSEIGTLPEEMCRIPDVPGGYELAQRSFHFGLSQEKRVVNLQLSITSEDLELSINVQTELRGRENADAQEAARRFLQDRQDGETLARHFFKANIEYGNNNAEPA